MSMGVRERRTEIAVLKTLGFSGGLVMTLVIVEALALGVIGGLVGIGLAQATVGYMAQLPFMGFILGNFSGLSVSPARGRDHLRHRRGRWRRRRVRAGLRRLPRADHRHVEAGVMAVPLSYNVRSLYIRRKLTMLAVGGIALVIAVLIVLDRDGERVPRGAQRDRLTDQRHRDAARLETPS